MADEAGGVSNQGQKLQVAYGNALIAARGFGAPETIEAFAKAREAACGEKDASERLAADYGLYAGSYQRGELPAMWAHAATFLRDVEAKPDSPEAGVAHRVAGITHWFAGEYREARDHLERALALFKPGRDDDLAFRFSHDPGVGAMLYLAITVWPMGELYRSLSLVESASTRTAGVAHVGTKAYAAMHAAMFELMRGDVARVRANATELARLAAEHDLSLWRAFGVLLEGWLVAQRGEAAAGIAGMRRGFDLLAEQNAFIFSPLLKVAQAEAEGAAGDAGRAILVLDEALATAEQVGHRAFVSELHRMRGEMLLKLDPANSAPAEEALKTAIVIAKRQGARSFELRAALGLAKLCQSTGRPVEAHAVLAAALEGFLPTPEMPQIAEAEALLAALTETDEVKAEAERRQRRQHLQVSYGNALMAARGFGAAETTEPFARARDGANGEKDALEERLAADFGLWAGSYARGELTSMRAHAAAFLADVAGRPDSAEAGVAHRVQGATHWFAGEYVQARHHLERALALFEPGRDDDLAFRFGIDPDVPTMVYLAFVLWSFGEIDRALPFVERMRQRVSGLTYANTLALGAMHASMFELMRGDRSRARRNALELARVVREYDLPMFRAFGEFLEGWANADGGALTDGLEGMRRGAESLRQKNALTFDGLIKIALSEAEARAGDLERAIVALDEALATVERTGYRAFEAEVRRARGEMLLRRDPADIAPAEQALQTAVATARQHGTRAFELRAALSLAKLYRSIGRLIEAHAVLASALEGFSPTHEIPEIAEAQALLAAVVETEEVKAAEAQRQRRLHLQTAYGRAMMWAKGLSAEETRAALLARDGAHSQDRQLCRPLRGGPLSVDLGLLARRIAVGAGAGIDLPERSRGYGAARGSRRRPPQPRPRLLPGRRFSRGAEPLRACSRGLQP
jgi:predicted ATPase